MKLKMVNASYDDIEISFNDESYEAGQSAPACAGAGGASEDGYHIALEEIRSGSITPTTFRERNYKDIHRDLVFEELYRFGQTSVKRFGINTLKANEEIEKAREDKAGDDEAAATPAESEHTSTHSGNRSESSSRRTKSSKANKKAKNVEHLNVEKEAMEKAVEHLLSEEGPRTVLVDILERDKDYLLSGDAKTHTVVLYRNSEREGKVEILVIDPSNFKFSAHLSNQDMKNTLNRDDIIIMTRCSDIKIYQPQDDVGSENNQWRDCIDIAVKLAIGLSSRDHEDIDINKIKENEVIKNISNVTEIEDIIGIMKAPIRIKQKSDPEVVKKFNNVKFLFHQIIELAKSTVDDDSTTTKLQEKFFEIIKNANSEEDIEQITRFTEGIKTTFNDSLDSFLDAENAAVAEADSTAHDEDGINTLGNTGGDDEL